MWRFKRKEKRKKIVSKITIEKDKGEEGGDTYITVNLLDVINLTYGYKTFSDYLLANWEEFLLWIPSYSSNKFLTLATYIAFLCEAILHTFPCREFGRAESKDLNRRFDSQGESSALLRESHVNHIRWIELRWDGIASE